MWRHDAGSDCSGERATQRSLMPMSVLGRDGRSVPVGTPLCCGCCMVVLEFYYRPAGILVNDFLVMAAGSARRRTGKNRQHQRSPREPLHGC